MKNKIIGWKINVDDDARREFSMRHPKKIVLYLNTIY